MKHDTPARFVWFFCQAQWKISRGIKKCAWYFFFLRWLQHRDKRICPTFWSAIRKGCSLFFTEESQGRRRKNNSYFTVTLPIYTYFCTVGVRLKSTRQFKSGRVYWAKVRSKWKKERMRECIKPRITTNRTLKLEVSRSLYHYNGPHTPYWGYIYARLERLRSSHAGPWCLTSGLKDSSVSLDRNSISTLSYPPL